ncbi:hypothetical protein Pan216_34580 [Planctomycetes bacterium Pan216]|uniref:Uncharacterized protein n=1 Tax=Kolteria novifilia TaxID=2527975 RepID=A0A518B6I6_9BACT|nr:hypothetical protein Pan216_34580 [Planctomycetes bacterium Pan216]
MTRESDDLDLIGYLLNSLEPDEEQAIEEQLERDPALRERLEEVRALIAPLSEDDLGVDVPSGLGERTLERIGDHRLGTMTEASDASSGPRFLDVLIAASVLACLSTLALPAIGELRREHARLFCANKLRQLGTAFGVYADQESERLPFIATGGPFNNAGCFAVQLKERHLLSSDAVLLCPSANNGVVHVPTFNEFLEATDRLAYVDHLRRQMGGSYGYSLGHMNRGHHAGAPLRQSARPVLSDRPPRTGDPLFVNSPNHEDAGQNVLFANGCVRWLPSRTYGCDEDLFVNDTDLIASGVNSDDTVIGTSESTPFPPDDF